MLELEFRPRNSCICVDYVSQTFHEHLVSMERTLLMFFITGVAL
jgi:hypothetical protein